MDNQNMVYMAYDGDNAGRLCGRAILADNVDALHEVSKRITLGHEIVKRWVEAHGGNFISGGGDEGVFSLPASAIPDIEELRADYEFATNLTTTIGIGNTLSEAGKAMLVGKFRGKNTVVQYDPSLEKVIQEAQEKVKEGTASQEEKKIGEAYLQDNSSDGDMKNENKSEQDKSAMKDHTDCPYCQAMEFEGVDDPSHCQYCHDMENETEPCPYCKQADGDLSDGPQNDPKDNSDADCEYCQDSENSPDPNHDDFPDDQTITPTAGPTVKNPTTTDSENYSGQDLNDPDLPKPDPISDIPEGLGVSYDEPTIENTKLAIQGPNGNGGDDDGPPGHGSQGVDTEANETAEQIAARISELPPDTQLDPQEENNIDDTDLATGTAMEDGTSRPDDYDEENAPKDMGLSEDENEDSVPNISSLMQEGLDSHADDIAKERVVNLVSEALTGFKSSKDILERAKEQAPQLYESSIAMLRAMIEMCKMLGLGEEAGSPDENDPLGEGRYGEAAMDQPPEGSAPPAKAHTAEKQNPPKPGDIKRPPEKENVPVKKPKGQSASQ